MPKGIGCFPNDCQFDFRENSPTLGECVHCGRKAPVNNIFDPEVSN